MASRLVAGLGWKTAERRAFLMAVKLAAYWVASLVLRLVVLTVASLVDPTALQKVVRMAALSVEWMVDSLALQKVVRMVAWLVEPTAVD